MSLHNVFYSMQRFNSAIIYDRDFSYNFFGFKVITRFQLLIYLTSHSDPGSINSICPFAPTDSRAVIFAED